MPCKTGFAADYADFADVGLEKVDSSSLKQVEIE
jgi:hypothetical protein